MTLIMSFGGCFSVVLMIRSLSRWTPLKRQTSLYVLVIFSLLGLCKGLSYVTNCSSPMMNGSQLIWLIFSLSWSYHIILIFTIIKRYIREGG
ncbi:hypothetical protein I6N95_01760 [Vagococcus sp. BWB3-3]|uniref:Uncharacterized protein n=1 Tax=Vagococcus allomyrinae TaxID=2794353 RepID=A0A940P2A1_9ENTE|nr:hypothetical protein [Vagococcus allomyrinae]MBP1039725.1 hypothetical protein [Vagococcus allomyrinae]